MLTVAILSMVATLLSPFFAVQATMWLNESKEKRERKRALFHTLMLTRGHGTLTPEHVKALNSIDIEFHGDRKAKEIVSAWRAYQNHLYERRERSDAEAAVWRSTSGDRLCSLLVAMAKYFKYRDFDEALIRKTNYIPQYYEDLEVEGMEIRKLLLEILRGNRAVPIVPILLSPTTEQADPPEQLSEPTKLQIDDPAKR